jgi:hypothetical protein
VAATTWARMRACEGAGGLNLLCVAWYGSHHNVFCTQCVVGSVSSIWGCTHHSPCDVCGLARAAVLRLWSGVLAAMSEGALLRRGGQL